MREGRPGPPLPTESSFVSYLKKHRERQFGLGFAKETDYVFCMLPDGRPIHHRNLTKAFAKAADRAGLDPEGKRRLRFHDLRRTYGSMLVAGGCSVAYVAQQLRDTPAMVLSTYLELFNSRGQAETGLAAIKAARGE